MSRSVLMQSTRLLGRAAPSRRFTLTNRLGDIRGKAVLLAHLD